MSDVKEAKLSPSRQKIVDDIVALMNKGADNWQKTWRSLGRPNVNFSTNKHYRGINAFILMLVAVSQNRADNRWGTFSQAKSAGYSIKAGAKGVPIEVYKIIDKRTRTVADFVKIREETKNLDDEEKQAFYQKHLYSILKMYHVFNGEDIEGLNPPIPKTSAENDEKINRIENIIKNSPAKITNDGKDSAYYRLCNDTIHLPLLKDFYTVEDYYATALHEIAHSTGHKSRLNRDMSGIFGDKNYAMEELRAELSSVLLCNEFSANLGNKLDNHAAYLNHWSQVIEQSPDELFKAIKDADCITEYVLGLDAQKTLANSPNENEPEEAERE